MSSSAVVAAGGLLGLVKQLQRPQLTPPAVITAVDAITGLCSGQPNHLVPSQAFQLAVLTLCRVCVGVISALLQGRPPFLQQLMARRCAVFRRQRLMMLCKLRA